MARSSEGPWSREGRGKWSVTDEGKQISLATDKDAAFDKWHRAETAGNRGHSHGLLRGEVEHPGTGKPKVPTEPMRPGLIERREVEYKRNGTQVLIGNFEFATGEVIAPTVQQTRGEVDFATHIKYS